MTKQNPAITRLAGSFAWAGLAMIVIPAGVAWAGSGKFDKQMQPVLEHYLKIPEALAADKTDGVTQAAKEIERLAAKLDVSSVSGVHARHLKRIPARLRSASKKLAAARDIQAMREALKELSKPVAMWVSISRPEGFSVAYCSMAPGSWIQRGTTIANPYYGAKMLRCGEIVSGVRAQKKKPPRHEDNR